jgi:hypothetical protein
MPLNTEGVPRHSTLKSNEIIDLSDELLETLMVETDGCFGCAIDVICRTTASVLAFARIPVDDRKEIYDAIELFFSTECRKGEVMSPGTDTAH